MFNNIFNKIYASSNIEVKERTSEFKINIGQTFKDEKRDLIIINREKRKYRNQYKKWYKYKCNKCGWDKGWIEESSLLNGNGCACCSGNVIVEGINDIPTTAPWMVKYFQGGYNEAKKYTSNSGKKIIPICPDCGRVYSKKIAIANINLNKGFGCSCKDTKSKISKYMTCLLIQLENKNNFNNFEIEKRFDWCIYFNPYKNKNCFGIYDFVIEKLKLIIETDGGFHRQDNSMNGQTKEESQYIDKSKDYVALKNGYEVVRISDVGDFKENIINSKLNEIFDLSNIDWTLCKEYSMKNIYKEICLDYICNKMCIEELHNKYKYSKKYIKDIINKNKDIFLVSSMRE